MIFTPDNTDDISRYYRNTFVKFRETGDRLFYIKYVKENKVLGNTSDGTPFELLLDSETPYEVDYILPHKSFFQHNDYACLLQRIPAKQYQRGISENNVTISALKSTGSAGNIGVGFESLEAFVSKQMFMSLTQALAENTKLSVVLSPRFAFVPNSRRIYADLTCVAQVQPKHKVVNCFHKLFKPELEQLAQGSIYKVV